MRTADEWFEAYGESHQNPINKAIHWVCVPVIVFATLGLLWLVPMPGLGGLLGERSWRPMRTWIAHDVGGAVRILHAAEPVHQRLYVRLYGAVSLGNYAHRCQPLVALAGQRCGLCCRLDCTVHRSPH